MATLFINYRHTDCGNLAKYLAEYLQESCEEGTYFFDKASIGYSDSIPDEVWTHLEAAKVLLVLIGSKWKDARDKDGDRRLLQPSDWVRREIETAIEKGKLIYPILHEGVDFDEICTWLQDKVPSLSPLKDKKYFPVKEKTLHRDLELLLEDLENKAGLTRKDDAPTSAEFNARKALTEKLTKKYPLPKPYLRPTSPKPFKSLEYFQKEDAALFFGRNEEIWTLCEALNRFPLVLLYGLSGVGKSSLLQAGVLTRLEAAQSVKYLRREKTIGYHLQLLEQMDSSSKGLVFLDQVEELFTDPRADRETEIRDFFRALVKASKTQDEATFLLSFRSEYYAPIRDLLFQQGLTLHPEQELFLKPLNGPGIEEAITGVSRDPLLQSRYRHLHVAPELVEELIRDMALGPHQESHIAPLLQYQLTRLWEDATSRVANDHEPVSLSLDRYLALKKSSLEELLDEQEALLKEGFARQLENGLVWDVLRRYVSDQETATQLQDSKVASFYSHIPQFETLLDALKNKTRLLIPVGKQSDPVSRLAHDALAPVISSRYQDSDRPGQRAWRIIETKRRETAAGKEPDYSESDINTLLEGREAMERIPSDEWEKIEKDRQTFEVRKQERFDLAFGNAISSIEHLQYPEALKQIHIAQHEGIHLDSLLHQVTRLPFTALELKEWNFLYDTLACAKDLGADDGSPLLALYEAGERDPEIWRSRLAAWRPGECKEMQMRHFPTLCEVPGGPFQMGSDQGFPREKPIRKVYVDAFRMAETAVTWWQYGLFCLDTDRDLPGDSGFGRGGRPVINLSWHEAIDYCNWLSMRQGLEPVYEIKAREVEPHWERSGYRLPTEAEWEYAAREGGKDVLFGNGKDLADPDEMNFDSGHEYNTYRMSLVNAEKVPSRKGRGKTTPAKTFAPNALGLYNMSGNVYEWCWDIYKEDHYQTTEESHNPHGPSGEKDSFRVVRGGSWVNIANNCRCSFRLGLHPLDRYDGVGFRVVRR